MMFKNLVTDGFVDGLTPKAVIDKYPVFGEYAYNTFASSLQGSKVEFRNLVDNRDDAMRGILKSYLLFLLFKILLIIYLTFFYLIIYCRCMR